MKYASINEENLRDNTKFMFKAKVAVINTKPETILDDISKSMEMADFTNSLDSNRATILKDNISWHFPFPGANTTPWQLEGTVLTLKNASYNNLVAVENNTVVTNPFRGHKLNKYLSVYQKYQIPLKYVFREKDMNWVKYTPKAPMLVLNKIYKKGIYLPKFFFDKNIIHLPTTKCHIYTTTTGAMKNAFGGLLNTKRHYCHSWIHEVLVDLLAIQKEIHSGIFTVMDGTTAGNGPGPRTMKPEIKNYILASGDSVAIDAVAAKMMGFEPMSIKYIRLAHQRGLGIGKIEEIEVVGENISNINFHFRVSDNPVSRAGKFIWFGPLKRLQKLFFHTPLVYLFVFGSAFYHDYFWWPTRGKKIFNQWLRSPWGQLFKKY